MVQELQAHKLVWMTVLSQSTLSWSSVKAIVKLEY